MPGQRGPYKQYEYRESRKPVPKSSAHAADRPPPPKNKKRRKVAAIASDRTTVSASSDPPASHSQSIEVGDASGAPYVGEQWHFVNETECETVNGDEDFCHEIEEEDAFQSDEEDVTLPTDNVELREDPDSGDDSDDEYVLATASDLHLSVPEKIKVLLLLATKLRHKLTYEAAECILRLVGVLSKNDNPFSASKHVMKSAISLYSSSLSEHHVCPNCGFYNGVFVEIKQCDNCPTEIDAKRNKKEGNIFLDLSVAEQIKSLLQHGLQEELIQPQHRQKIKEGNYEDIHDGKIYRKLLTPNCLSFNFFVDGLSVFSTSKKSAWPVLLSWNEFPLHLRRKHVTMASVWLGKDKPKMNEYLKPFVKECIQLQREGITLSIKGQDKTYIIVPLMCVSDSVARPLLRNSTQFNGWYGCGLCHHPGYRMRLGRGHCRSYSISEREFPRRTHEETLELARRAITSRTAQLGIKGRSILTEIQGFDITDCLDLDLFHALVNCAKRFTNLWLSKKYALKPFNVQHKFAEVNQRLLSITPTDTVSRTPRSLEERSDYRGHEWFHWVVFYSIPVLAGILPKRFLNHWSLVVHGVVLLMQNSVSKSEVVYAGRYLRQFNAEIDALYGSENVTFSTHLLTHLKESTVNFAQPWTHSAFLYENFLGELKSTVHSSNGVAHQISKHMQLKIALKSMKSDLDYAMSDNEKDFLKSVMCCGKPLVDPYLTIQGAGFLGVPKTIVLDFNLHRAILREGVEAIHGREYLMFDRCTVNGEVFQSVNYSRVEKQNNSIVLLTDDKVFEIHSFIVIDNLGFALGHYLVRNRTRVCNVDIPHIQIFSENVEGTLRCVPISKFEMKLLSFSLKISDCEFLRFTCVNVLQMEMLH